MLRTKPDAVRPTAPSTPPRCEPAALLDGLQPHIVRELVVVVEVVVVLVARPLGTWRRARSRSSGGPAVAQSGAHVRRVLPTA